MAKVVTYESDLSEEVIPEQNAVTLTVERNGETKVIIISEDELATMMEECEDLGTLILSDD